jgi:hypothetical protein
LRSCVEYASTFLLGTDWADIVASIAPPIEKFFIEFQIVPNQGELHAWGSPIPSTESPKEM